MYKILLVLLLTGCATTWVPIGGTDQYTYYAAETASGGITGNMSVAEMADFNKEQIDNGHHYKSIVGEAEYNCLTGQFRITEEAYFSENIVIKNTIPHINDIPRIPFGLDPINTLCCTD